MFAHGSVARHDGVDDDGILISRGLVEARYSLGIRFNGDRVASSLVMTKTQTELSCTQIRYDNFELLSRVGRVLWHPEVPRNI